MFIIKTKLKLKYQSNLSYGMASALLVRQTVLNSLVNECTIVSVLMLDWNDYSPNILYNISTIYTDIHTIHNTYLKEKLTNV